MVVVPLNAVIAAVVGPVERVGPVEVRGFLDLRFIVEALPHGCRCQHFEGGSLCWKHVERFLLCSDSFNKEKSRD